MIIVSACLCGINTKYNGGNNLNEEIVELLKQGRAIIVCPEQLGGMSTPRPTHEIIAGTGRDVLNGKARVKSKEGMDSTEEFVKGAEEVLRLCKNVHVEYAILKARSPSCGMGVIYDGSFSGKTIEGNGVTAELLISNGIKVYTEEQLGNIEIYR